MEGQYGPEERDQPPISVARAQNCLYQNLLLKLGVVVQDFKVQGQQGLRSKTVSQRRKCLTLYRIKHFRVERGFRMLLGLPAKIKCRKGLRGMLI